MLLNIILLIKKYNIQCNPLISTFYTSTFLYIDAFSNSQIFLQWHIITLDRSRWSSNNDNTVNTTLHLSLSKLSGIPESQPLLFCYVVSQGMSPACLPRSLRPMSHLPHHHTKSFFAAGDKGPTKKFHDIRYSQCPNCLTALLHDCIHFLHARNFDHILQIYCTKLFNLTKSSVETYQTLITYLLLNYFIFNFRSLLRLPGIPGSVISSQEVDLLWHSTGHDPQPSECSCAWSSPSTLRCCSSRLCVAFLLVFFLRVYPQELRLNVAKFHHT